MDFINDLKAKVDANSDGKLSVDDLTHLKEQHPKQSQQIDELLKKADTNGDGKVDFADLQGLLGAVGGMFGKK